jgi:hypothetical protein
MSAFLGRLRSAGVSLAVFAAAVSASPGDAPGDYSHTIPLSVSGNQAVVQLQLPRAVYLEARSADLRDLRVFDAAGTSLPFALIEPVRPAQESRSTTPVAVFPVHAPAGAASRLPDGLQIQTNENGAVISVSAPQARSAGDVLVSLVLDLQNSGQTANRQDAAPVSTLALTLPAEVKAYSARVALETSDDLQDWETIVETSVNWLVNNQGASMRRDRIEFPPSSFRFARIRWLEGTPIEFSTITAERVARRRMPAQSEGIVLQAKPGTAGQDLLYEAPIAVPAESLGLELHGQNIVLPALIGQYHKVVGSGGGNPTSVQLRPVANATFFQLTQNRQRRVSADIGIAPTHAAQWVLRPQATIAERPGLRLRWTPTRMVFVASGKGPYTLAFGRTGVQSSQVPVTQVAPGFSARELAMLEQANAGEPVRHNVRDDGSHGPAPNHSIWLWALLLCGVAALAAMAWKLARQLKEAGPDQPPT